MYKLVLLSLLALVPAGGVVAAIGDEFSPEKGLDLNRSFEAQRDAIVRALGDGETYVEIAAQDLVAVKEALNRMASLLDGVQSVEQLPEAMKIRLFNDQEQVNTLLGRAHADSRVICKREKPTGSNRPVNTCMTVAERRRAREGATDFMRYQPKAQGPVENR